MYEENKEYLKKFPLNLCDLMMHYIDIDRATDQVFNIIIDIDCSGYPHLKTLKNVLMEKIDLMELHFSYSVEGKGFNDAKKDFISRISVKSLSL
jgi:hypothetical protein